MGITIVIGFAPTIFTFAVIWSLAPTTWVPWGVLAIGLVFTMVAAVYTAQTQRAEQVLQASEQRFRALIEHATDAVALIDADGMARYHSPAVTRILGYSPDELAGRDAFDLLSAEDSAASRAGYSEFVQRRNAARTTQRRYRRKDGSWRWLEATARNLLFDPAVAAVVVNFRDITDSREAEAQLRARLRHQATLAEFGPQALTQTTIETLLDKAAAAAALTLDLDCSYLAEFIPSEQKLLMRAAFGWGPEGAEQASAGLGVDSQAGFALLSAAPVAAEDLRAETRFRVPPSLNVLGIVSGLAVMVQGGERPFGVLGVYARQRRVFNQDEVTFLQTLANVLAAAIARTRAEAEINARARELALLNDLVRAALATSALSSVLQAIAPTLAELFGADSYALTQWDEASQTEAAISTASGSLSVEPPPQVGEPTPTQAALHSVGPVVIEDLFNSPLVSERLAPAYAARSLLSLPLLTGCVRLGALHIGFQDPHEFAPDEISRGERVADRLAQAIIQVQLLHETRQRAEELTLLGDVSRALRVAANRAEMLPIILDQLLTILPAEGVAFGRPDLATNELRLEIGRGALERASGQRLPSSSDAHNPGPGGGARYLIDDARLNAPLAWKAWPSEFAVAACVPLIVQPELLGVLIAVRRESFSPASNRLLAAVADMSANALHRTELHERAVRQAEQLAVVNTSGRALAELLDLPQNYQRLAAAIRQLLPDIAAVTLLLYDRERQVLTRAYCEPAGAAKPPAIPISAPNLAGLSQAIHTRRPVITSAVPGAAQAAVLAALAGPAERVARSALAVPLLSRGEVLGVVQVLSNLPARFQETDAEILSIMANVAAVTIQNARLFQELQASNVGLAQRVEEHTADLSAANAQLARAARLKDEFLASMSHELRTPLNGILVLIENLQEQLQDQLGERHLRSLSSIELSGRHLLSLINDILDVSKIEAGRLDLQLEPVLVEEICQACLAFVKELANQKRLGLSLGLEVSQAQLTADPRRLKQILVNLLSNAVKFTPEGGQVRLEVVTDADAGLARFTVHDTGIGIAADDLARLFQPFVQLDSRLARQHEGTGLGLALVRRLAELHGGGVTVESQVGAGSRFSVTLPLGDGNRSAPPPSRPITAVRHALIVEDSATAAEQIARYLHELGIQTTIHAQGAGAVEAALKLRPDIVFVDLLMPDQSGWEVLAQLKAEPATQTVPVVIVSVMQAPAEALAGGAAAHLAKPISREQVRRVLGQLGQAADSAAAPAAPSMPDEPAPLRGRGLILLAEDHEINIQAIGDAVQDRGYHLVVARNGAEALDRAREKRPDLILMDIQMPEMDGLEAMRRLRADPDQAGIPIIALTALAMPGDRERCLAAGANEYLTKPVSVRNLMKTIDNLLKP